MDFDPGAHALERAHKAGARPVDTDTLDHEPPFEGTRHHAGDGQCGGGDVAGELEIHGREPRRRLHAQRPPRFFDFNAQMPQEALGMIARRRAAMDGGWSGALQTGEEQGRDRLRAEHSCLIVNWAERTAGYPHRQPSGLAPIDDARTRLAQRIDDPFHRSLAQQLVAIHLKLAWRSGEKPDQDTGRGRRIAGVEFRSLLEDQSPQAPSADYDGRVARFPDIDAELAQDGKIGIDVVRLRDVADGAGAVGKGCGEGGALGKRLVAWRRPGNEGCARRVKHDRDRHFP